MWQIIFSKDDYNKDGFYPMCSSAMWFCQGVYFIKESISPFPRIWEDPDLLWPREYEESDAVPVQVIAFKQPGSFLICLIEASYPIRSTTIMKLPCCEKPESCEEALEMKYHVEKENSKNTWRLRYMSEEVILEVELQTQLPQLMPHRAKTNHPVKSFPKTINKQTKKLF